MGIIEAFAEVDKRHRDDEAVIRTLVEALGKVTCPECDHPARYHLDEYGCEYERGDGYPNGSEILQALGPCCCKGDDGDWFAYALLALKTARERKP